MVFGSKRHLVGCIGLVLALGVVPLSRGVVGIQGGTTRFVLSAKEDSGWKFEEAKGEQIGVFEKDGIKLRISELNAALGPFRTNVEIVNESPQEIAIYSERIVVVDGVGSRTLPFGFGQTLNLAKVEAISPGGRKLGSISYKRPWFTAREGQSFKLAIDGLFVLGKKVGVPLVTLSPAP